MVQEPRGDEPASNASRLRCRAPKAPMPICFTLAVQPFQKNNFNAKALRRKVEETKQFKDAEGPGRWADLPRTLAPLRLGVEFLGPHFFKHAQKVATEELVDVVVLVAAS